MTDLVEFLHARLADGEKVASDAEHLVDRDAWLDILERSLGDGRDDAKRAATSHILEFRPSRVLADVEAKRRIIEEERGRLLDAGKPERYLNRSPLVRLLALPYADHPDYREEWRP